MFLIKMKMMIVHDYLLLVVRNQVQNNYLLDLMMQMLAFQMKVLV